MSDESFHEIQLNGKQLVFLFMATTVVVVVVFLCGVLVGRGVRANQAIAAGEVAAAGPAEVIPDQAARAEPSEPASEPAASPQTSVDTDLSYYKRLEESGTSKENLKSGDSVASRSTPTPPPSAKTDAKTTTPAPPAATPAVPAATSPAPAAATGQPAQAVIPPEPSSEGFAIQVAALRERSEADAIAQRLLAKGYQAYVLSPAAGQATMYRVRVGKFKNRRDAQDVVVRLTKEEQFKPWITR